MENRGEKFKRILGDSFIYAGILILMTAVLTALVIFSIDYRLEVAWNFLLNNTFYAIGLWFIMLFVIIALFFYLSPTKRSKNKVIGRLAIIFITVILVLLLEWPFEKFVQVYVIPLLLATAIILVLQSSREAFIVNAILMLIFVIIFLMRITTGSFEDGESIRLYCIRIIVGMFSGMFIILVFKNVVSRIKFILYGLTVSLMSLPIAFVAFLFIGTSALDSITNALWAMLGNIFCIVLFMFILPIFESLFRISTTFKLNEYCNFNNALLKRLSENAPGTFNHSLMVGNLAESCAIAIGENPQLARAAAYYHDVGKLADPKYFSENQSGYNPHDDLIPEVSVMKITKHTEYGYALLKKYKYPEEIAEIALQHHGTSPVGYFYQRALSLTEGKIDIKNYSYSGPKPRTKIAAIIMICDAAEAASRSIRTAGAGAEELVGKLINEKIDYGQLDECPITMSELETVKSTIFSVLSGIYHTRIDYDEKKK